MRAKGFGGGGVDAKDWGLANTRRRGLSSEAEAAPAPDAEPRIGEAHGELNVAGEAGSAVTAAQCGSGDRRERVAALTGEA